MRIVKQILLAVLLAASTSGAQSITDVMNAVFLARTTSTTVLTITASQGDGGNFKLVKNSGSSINVTAAFTSADGKVTDQSSLLRASGATATAKHVSYGDITCLIGINPGASAIAMGSLGSIPPNGIGWVCATNITGGAQTTPVSGTAVWP